MKKSIIYLLFVTFITVTLFSCKEDDPKLNNVFTVVKEYVAANNLDFNKVADGKQVQSTSLFFPGGTFSQTKLDSFLTNTVIVDIRSTTDYSAGHISGAINSTLADVISKVKTANPGTKHVMVVDADGQTAPYAVVALRMSGYPTAKILKWGMSSWNSNCNVWDAKKGNVAVGNANWLTPPVTVPTIGTYDYPIVNSSLLDANLALEERITKMLTDGPQMITNTEALTNYANYHIINYWPQSLVDVHGIVKNAYRVDALTTANINVLNTAKPTVFYCYTGQTSAFLAAWAKVMGYNAKFISYGTNGMIYDDMNNKSTANTWGKGTEISRTLPLVTK